jgi:methanethiol S-methyltransferase
MVSPRRKDRFIIIYLPNLFFFIVLIGTVLFTYLASWPWFLLGASLHLPLRVFELSIGQFLTVLACTFIVWGVISLGLNRAEGKELTKPEVSSQPVTKGAYDYCRHPITFGFIIVIFGFALTYDFVPLMLTAVCYPFLLFGLLRYEEKELVARFGQVYLEYKKSTPVFPVPFKKRNG